MVYLALDIGLKRTGIAKSDSMGIIIKPYKTILTEDLLDEIQNLDQEFGIDQLVIGEPINIQSGNDDAIKNVIKMRSLIEKNFKHLKIAMIDERFTSKEAEFLIKKKGIKLNKDNKQLIDQYAAAIILETYFALNKNTYDADYLDEDS